MKTMQDVYEIEREINKITKKLKNTDKVRIDLRIRRRILENKRKQTKKNVSMDEILKSIMSDN